MSEAPRRPTSPRYAWYVVAVLTLANISGNIDQQILSYLVRPLKRDFGISDVQVSYLIGLAFAVFFTVLGLPIARLADRSNRRNIMAGGVTLWSIFTALCATAKSYGALLLLRMGVGVGEATLNAPGVSLLSDYFPRERLGRAMSVYSMGIFLGSGAAYAIGGSIVGLLGIAGSRHIPVLGQVHPWQLVFLAVGLPGLALGALIFFTVREPERQATLPSAQLPLRVLYRYVGANRRTFLTLGLGFAMSSMVNLSLVAWLPTFLTRTYGWNEGQAGRVQGALTATVGVAAVLFGGWLSDRCVKRGRVDGPLRVGMIGAAGMLVAASAFPLMPTPALAVCWLVVVNVFAALPWRGICCRRRDRSVAAPRAGCRAVFPDRQPHRTRTRSHVGGAVQ